MYEHAPPERDGSEMNRRRGDLSKYGRRKRERDENEIYFILKLNLLRERSDVIQTDMIRNLI